MRALLLTALAVAALIGVSFLAFPDQMARLGEPGLTQLLLIIMSGVLVASGLFGLRGTRADRQWPLHALFWLALIGTIVFLARAFNLS